MVVIEIEMGDDEVAEFQKYWDLPSLTNIISQDKYETVIPKSELTTAWKRYLDKDNIAYWEESQ